MTVTTARPTLAGLPLFDLPGNWAADRVSWCLAYLRQNPQVYRGFVRLADEWRAVRADRPTSADMLCHALRFQLGLSATGDDWNINNNLTSLFGRSWVDDLMPWELQSLREAAHA